MLIPVLVVANSPSLQRGLAALITSSGDFTVSETLNWEGQPSQPYSVVLGELESDVHTELLSEPFVLLSNEYVLSPAPGRGLLNRESEDEAILCALGAVLLGLSVADATHLNVPESSSTEHGLTPRELEILTLLGEGFSNRQIAEALFISENTVKFHLSSVFSKLQVSNRAEAVSVGVRSGILML